MTGQRVCLTELSEPFSNNGHDNKQGDLIIYTGDLILDGLGTKYRVDRLLGTGTFGQVFCVTLVGSESLSTFAIKVSKSSLDHRTQTRSEIRAMECLISSGTPAELTTISQIIDSFDYLNHICIRMPVLSDNMLTLLMSRQWIGMPISFVQSVVRQALQALCLFRRVGLVHLDIKPENVVQADPFSSNIKLIDFGSSRFVTYAFPHFEYQTLWYRAPEVLLHIEVGFPADMWSLAVTAVELFLATPVFQAPNEYQLLELFERRLGPIPESLVRRSPRREDLFTRDGRLKPEQQMCREHGERYIELDDEFVDPPRGFATVFDYAFLRGNTKAERAAERERRQLFLDFIQAVLKFEPSERLTAENALLQTFLTTNFGPDRLADSKDV
jgi:serine/threonine protein kinase